MYAFLLFWRYPFVLMPSNTVLPVVIAIVCMIGSWISRRRLPVLYVKQGVLAAGLGFVALYFFHKGLDDENDWYACSYSAASSFG
jgi:hypothetical protein